jgi:hypothetical protein
MIGGHVSTGGLQSRSDHLSRARPDRAWKPLVQVAKNGITDEDQLVARSLMHLISLAPNEPKSS